MDSINVDKAVEFVLSCMNFDGGFGCRPGSESHAGQVSPLIRFRNVIIAVREQAVKLLFPHHQCEAAGCPCGWEYV